MFNDDITSTAQEEAGVKRLQSEREAGPQELSKNKKKKLEKKAARKAYSQVKNQFTKLLYSYRKVSKVICKRCSAGDCSAVHQVDGEAVKLCAGEKCNNPCSIKCAFLMCKRCCKAKCIQEVRLQLCCQPVLCHCSGAGLRGTPTVHQVTPALGQAEDWGERGED